MGLVATRVENLLVANGESGLPEDLDRRTDRLSAPRTREIDVVHEPRHTESQTRSQLFQLTVHRIQDQVEKPGAGGCACCQRSAPLRKCSQNMRDLGSKLEAIAEEVKDCPIGDARVAASHID